MGGTSDSTLGAGATLRQHARGAPRRPHGQGRGSRDNYNSVQSHVVVADVWIWRIMPAMDAPAMKRTRTKASRALKVDDQRHLGGMAKWAVMFASFSMASTSSAASSLAMSM